MKQFKQFKLPIIPDDRFTFVGHLAVPEEVGFDVVRVYALTEGKKPTGAHCHKVEQECFICFSGGCVAEIDDGSGLRDVPLRVGDAIYVPAYVWHHFKSWEPNTVVVALSSTAYDPTRADYVVDYEEFQKLAKH